MVDDVTDVVDGLVGGITGGLFGGVFGHNNTNQDNTDSDVTADAGVEIVDADIVDAGVEAIIDPVEDVVGDLDIDLDADTNLLNPSGTDNDAGDSDVVVPVDLDVADTDLIGGDLEVELDPVEAIVGDVDLDLGAAADVLGDQADGVVNDGAGGTGEDTLLADIGDGLEDIAEAVIPGLNGDDNAQSDLTVDSDIDLVDENLADTDIDAVLDPVEEVVGDIDAALNAQTDLLGDNETDNESGDSDLSVDIDIDLVDAIDVVDVEVDIPLDDVEAITGDIDLDLNSAINLLNPDSSESSIGGSEAGSDEQEWTESTIVDGGGLFDDVLGGIGGDMDTLPDPSGTVGEGLGVLDVEPEIDVGSLGGLF